MVWWCCVVVGSGAPLLPTTQQPHHECMTRTYNTVLGNSVRRERSSHFEHYFPVRYYIGPRNMNVLCVFGRSGALLLLPTTKYHSCFNCNTGSWTVLVVKERSSSSQPTVHRPVLHVLENIFCVVGGAEQTLQTQKEFSTGHAGKYIGSFIRSCTSSGIGKCKLMWSEAELHTSHPYTYPYTATYVLPCYNLGEDLLFGWRLCRSNQHKDLLQGHAR